MCQISINSKKDPGQGCYRCLITTCNVHGEGQRRLVIRTCLSKANRLIKFPEIPLLTHDAGKLTGLLRSMGMSTVLLKGTSIAKVKQIVNVNPATKDYIM